MLPICLCSFSIEAMLFSSNFLLGCIDTFFGDTDWQWLINASSDDILYFSTFFSIFIISIQSLTHNASYHRYYAIYILHIFFSVIIRFLCAILVLYSFLLVIFVWMYGFQATAWRSGCVHWISNLSNQKSNFISILLCTLL